MIVNVLKSISVVLVFLTGVSWAMAKDKLNEIESLEWKNRIIIINNVNDKELQKLQSSQQLNPLAERYVVWFAINEGQVLSNYKGMLNEKLSTKLLKKYYLNGKVKADNRVLLIGYDGYVKLQQTNLDLNVIYQTIDGMPMRQMEIQRQ